MKNLNEQLKRYRLKPDEYEMICQILGREPQGVEWALYSSLWSEHCSYKSSRVHLKKFKSSDPRIMTEEGENAGVLNLGEGESIAFKMESHNHPSYIEPFHGAATGVGGILRDIFTMGARPIAIGNYLCFGESQFPRMKSLLKGVVKGISYYGNCVGVPTVTGATHSEPEYNHNILVNAFALGLFENGDKPISAKAEGVGNLVCYVGAKTGADGVHGASMASESFDEDIETKRPTIQIGDAFFEKLLIEACLEALRKRWVVAMQDMGAAGLTSSTFEMAAKGNVGFDLDLSLIPLRTEGLGPEEILLSESQERMLLISTPENENKLRSLFNRWGLEFQVIGKVLKERKVKLHWRGELICDIDPTLIVDKAPQYEREFKKLSVKNLPDLPSIMKSAPGQNLIPHWIYRQYDQRVGLRTEQGAGFSVAQMRLKSGRSLGIALGCRPWLMKHDPVLGAFDAVFEPCLKLILQGFVPQGITDCLNFGNPEKPEIMSQFVAAVEAISLSAKLWQAPVISGNVSFYNETENKNIPPTPAVGVVGLRDKSVPPIREIFSKEDHPVGLVYLQKLNDSWDPEELVKVCYKLFEEIKSGHVYAAKLVTEKGVFNTARLMETSSVSLDIGNVKETENCLYQVLLEASDSFWKRWSNRSYPVGFTKKNTNKSQQLRENFETQFKEKWELL
jgi:phosphoribosylformylglycinamidine synthase II